MSAQSSPNRASSQDSTGIGGSVLAHSPSRRILDQMLGRAPFFRRNVQSASSMDSRSTSVSFPILSNSSQTNNDTSSHHLSPSPVDNINITTTPSLPPLPPLLPQNNNLYSHIALILSPHQDEVAATLSQMHHLRPSSDEVDDEVDEFEMSRFDDDNEDDGTTEDARNEETGSSSEDEDELENTDKKWEVQMMNYSKVEVKVSSEGIGRIMKDDLVL